MILYEGEERRYYILASKWREKVPSFSVISSKKTVLRSLKSYSTFLKTKLVLFLVLCSTTENSPCQCFI